jgi:hypothetical protein
MKAEGIENTWSYQANPGSSLHLYTFLATSLELIYIQAWLEALCALVNAGPGGAMSLEGAARPNRQAGSCLI